MEAYRQRMILCPLYTIIKAVMSQSMVIFSYSRNVLSVPMTQTETN